MEDFHIFQNDFFGPGIAPVNDFLDFLVNLTADELTV